MIKVKKQAKYIIGIFICLIALLLFTVLIHTASQKSVLGADFYTFWMAGKAVFQDHANPYSQELTDEIQMGKLGRLVPPGEDQMAYAYPPYGLLVIFPTIFLPFDWASALWLALNIVILALLILLMPVKTHGFLLTSFLFFPVFLNLILGTFDIFIIAGILIFFGWIHGQKHTSAPIQALAGVLLAWATMKPQLIWLVLVFVLLIAIREKYIVFLKSFLIALSVLIIISYILVPTWLVDWPHQVYLYSQYIKRQPTITEFLQVVFAQQTAFVLSGLAFLICCGTALLLLVRWWNGQLHWLKVLAWLGMMTYLFHLHGISYEQIIFLIPLILWVAFHANWHSPEVLFFWVSSIFISWIAFAIGVNHPVLDRSPVLFNLVWAGWILLKPRSNL